MSSQPILRNSSTRVNHIFHFQRWYSPTSFQVTRGLHKHTLTNSFCMMRTCRPTGKGPRPNMTSLFMSSHNLDKEQRAIQFFFLCYAQKGPNQVVFRTWTQHKCSFPLFLCSRFWRRVRRALFCPSPHHRHDNL